MTKYRGRVETLRRLKNLTSAPGSIVYLTNGSEGCGRAAFLYRAVITAVDEIPVDEWQPDPQSPNPNVTLRLTQQTKNSHGSTYNFKAGDLGVANPDAGMKLWSLRSYALEYLGIKEEDDIYV